jgi:hypothetical protein
LSSNVWRRPIFALVPVVLSIGLVWPAAASAAGPADNFAAPQSTDSTESTRVTLLLAHPLSLQDAVEVAGTLKEVVVAYAFSNDRVVGEYAPATGVRIEDYLATFASDYGTQPQVTGLVVLRNKDAQAEGRLPSEVATDLGAGYPALAATPVVYGGALAERIAAGQEDADRARSDSVAAALPVDWRPDYANVVTGGSPPFVWSQYYWYDSGLYLLPNQIGLEFEVNEHNDGVARPNSMRPACLDPYYKDQFWASNYGWSWSASSLLATPVSSFGAYADYNDNSDQCRTNSLAIGLRWPKYLADYMGEIGLEISLTAPAGLTSTSRLSGNIQAVSEQYCLSWPGNTMSSTDCMGITPIASVWAGSPAGTYNRGTLAEWRHWIAPWSCWTSSDKGTVDPVPYSCFG